MQLNSSQELWCAKDTIGLFKHNHFSFEGTFLKLTSLAIAIVAIEAVIFKLEYTALPTRLHLAVNVTIIFICLGELAGAYYLFQATFSTISTLNEYVLEEVSLELERARMTHYFL